jgi:hypothetical protein
MAGARADKETGRYGRTVFRASDFVLEVRESAQCDFPISALNVCETLRDTWPCRAPFDIRFRRRRALRFLAHRERPIHLSKFSALAALSRGFCNGCKASELFRLGAIILYLRPQRIDSRCPLQRLTQCMTKWGSTGSRSGTARPFPLWRLRSSPHSPPIDPITREWYCPQARITGRLTFRPLDRFRPSAALISIAQKCGAFATYRAVSRLFISRISTCIACERPATGTDLGEKAV